MFLFLNVMEIFKENKRLKCKELNQFQHQEL